ncbi:MAG: hypothetical protein ABSA59_11380 [Terriglobia bacterium]|jgi:hypothetical protein
MKKFLLPMFAAVLLVFAPAARADDLYGARIWGYMSGEGSCYGSFDTEWANSASINTALNCVGWGYATATVAGAAMPGELRGYASATNLYGAADGESSLSFAAFDTIKVFSTDPTASSVYLQFTMYLTCNSD